MKRRKLALILPCYNEGPSLAALAERAIAGARRRNIPASEFELVLVNNGSSDHTPEILATLKAGELGSYIHPVHVVENQGYGHGVAQGLAAASSAFWLAWSHADEQCDPEDVFRAWELLEQSAGKLLVKGRRRGRGAGEWFFSRAFELTALLILRKKIHEVNAQPKAFDRELLGSLAGAPHDFSFDLYALLRAREAGYQIQEIDVVFPARRHGQSHWAGTFRSRVKTIARSVKFMLRYQKK